MLPIRALSLRFFIRHLALIIALVKKTFQIDKKQLQATVVFWFVKIQSTGLILCMQWIEALCSNNSFKHALLVALWGGYF